MPKPIASYAKYRAYYSRPRHTRQYPDYLTGGEGRFFPPLSNYLGLRFLTKEGKAVLARIAEFGGIRPWFRSINAHGVRFKFHADQRDAVLVAADAVREMGYDVTVITSKGTGASKDAPIMCIAHPTE